MTVNTTSNKTIVQGNGATTSFSFPFVYVAASDISVIYTDSNGNSQTIAPSNYTLNLNPKAPGQIWGIGGSVTYAPNGNPIPTGSSLTIVRTLPDIQNTTISNQGASYPNVIEGMGDYITMLTQQIQEQTTRALQFPIVDVNPQTILPPAAQRALKVLGFDASGNVTMLAQGSGGGGSTVAGINAGFANFVLPPLIPPTAGTGTGLTFTLPSGQAILQNNLLTIPQFTWTFKPNYLTEFYLNVAGSAEPFTIVETPLNNYTAAVRYPSLLKVWSAQADDTDVQVITMTGRIRPEANTTTDFSANVDLLLSQYQITNTPTAFSPGASINYGDVIVNSAGYMYACFTLLGGTLGASEPTGHTDGQEFTNGTVQLGYYGISYYGNNFRYTRNGGIQSYFSNIMASLTVDMQGESGAYVSDAIKLYIESQIKHCVTNRQNSAAYSFGQKVIAGGYVWINQTVAGGTTAGSSPFSGTYTPGTSTVIDGSITWLCIYTAYGSQEYYWMRTEQTMLIPTPADAHDSDASTLFEMIWNYIEFTWDWQWLAGASPIPNKTYLQVLQGVWDKNLATLYNNLTPTFQDNINPYTGESFTQQYTEDNCESYTGSIAASKIFNLLGDSTRSTNAATNAATVNAGLFLLINSEKGVIGWFYGDDFSWFQNPTLAWYPWYQAQFFPELHQIPAANSTLHADARQYVITFWNNWFSDPGLTAGLSNIMFGYLAARFWQDHEKANASVVMTETIFLANGLLSSDFGYYLKTKQILVNSNLLSTVNGAKVAFRDFVGNVTVLNRTRNATAAGTVQIFPQDYWVGVDSTGSAVTLNLPNRTLLTDSWSCIIKDIGGDAGTNNITITPDGGKIDGSGTKVISSNYGSVTIRYNKANNQFYTE